MYFVSDNLAGAGRGRCRRPSGRPTGISPPCSRPCSARRVPELARAAVQDPMRYVISAVRLACDDKVILNPIRSWAGFSAWPERSTGTRPRRLSTARGGVERARPDGDPLRDRPRDRISGSAGLFKPDGPDAVDHPAFPQPANALYFTSLRPTLGSSTGGARSGRLAAGLEHAVPGLARIHAPIGGVR